MTSLRDEAEADPRAGRSRRLQNPVASATRDRLLLFCVMLMVAVGNTGLQSVVPAMGRSLHIPDLFIAVAFSLSAVLWSVSAPFWARRLDRYGNKRMVVIGLAGFSVSLLFCGMSLSAGALHLLPAAIAFGGFVIGRGIYGTFGAAAPPAAQALVVARASRTDRTKALTLLASAFGLGTIIGPALAPFFVLSYVGLAGPLYVFALLGLCMLMVVVVALSDEKGAHIGQAAVSADPMVGSEPSDTSTLAADQDTPKRPVRLTDPRIWPWMLFGLVSGHAQAIAGQTMAFLIIDRLALPPVLAQPAIGIVLMSGAGAALLAQWGVIPRLNLDPRQLVLWGAVIAAVGCVSVVFAGDLHSTAIAFAIASMGFGFLRPGFSAGASLAVTDQEQGTVAGHVTAINGCVFALGPAAGIAMYDFSRPLPYLTCAGSLLLLAGYGLRRLSAARD